MKSKSNTLFSRHLANCKRRNIQNQLTFDEFINLVPGTCVYCGQSSFGVDRVFNQFPYTLENSVSCCKDCNYMKRDLPPTYFLSHIFKIQSYSHIVLSEKFQNMIEILNSDF